MKSTDEQRLGKRGFAPLLHPLLHVRMLEAVALLPFNLMTDNKATRKMTTDEPRGRSVCETPGHRQLITLAIKDPPSLTSNYFSKRFYGT